MAGNLALRSARDCFVDHVDAVFVLVGGLTNSVQPMPAVEVDADLRILFSAGIRNSHMERAALPSSRSRLVTPLVTG
jgi:hypothetical protein